MPLACVARGLHTLYISTHSGITNFSSILGISFSMTMGSFIEIGPFETVEGPVRFNRHFQPIQFGFVARHPVWRPNAMNLPTQFLKPLLPNSITISCGSRRVIRGTVAFNAECEPSWTRSLLWPP